MNSSYLSQCDHENTYSLHDWSVLAILILLLDCHRLAKTLVVEYLLVVTGVLYPKGWVGISYVFMDVNSMINSENFK